MRAEKRRRTRSPAAVLLACAVLLVAACGGEMRGKTGSDQARQELTGADEALLGAIADSANWASYGRDQANQRYSPLRQITPGNVGDLQLAWKYNTGVFHSFEASPVILDRTLYI